MKNETIRKLKNMRLPAFAETYQKQIENETEYQSLSFHERLALLADAEYDSRHNNNIQRLIKNAHLLFVNHLKNRWNKFSEADISGNLATTIGRLLSNDIV